MNDDIDKLLAINLNEKHGQRLFDPDLHLELEDAYLIAGLLLPVL